MTYRTHSNTAISVADMQARNRLAMVDYIRAHGQTSRTEIAQQLHMSQPTVMRMVEALMENGLVRSAGQKEWNGGRRRALIEFDGTHHLVIGVDLGGTKMYGALTNLRGDILHENHFQHHQSRSEESFSALCDGIDQLAVHAHTNGLPIQGMGLGVPGGYNQRTGVVINAPALDWNQFPLKARLSERFAYPLVIENDVNLAVIGEFWSEAQPGEDHLALITIGTGIGAGLIVNGELHTGAHDMAGEIGYFLPTPADLRQTYPGFGAFEQRASGTGIAERARQELSGVMDPIRLAALTAEDVFIAARQGQPWAAEILDETIDYLAQAIASLTLVMDPHVIVLGGGVSRSADLLIGPIQARLHGVIPVQPRLVASRLGYRAGVHGAVARLLEQMILHPGRPSPDHVP